MMKIISWHIWSLPIFLLVCWNPTTTNRESCSLVLDTWSHVQTACQLLSQWLISLVHTSLANQCQKCYNSKKCLKNFTNLSNCLRLKERYNDSTRKFSDYIPGTSKISRCCEFHVWWEGLIEHQSIDRWNVLAWRRNQP